MATSLVQIYAIDFLRVEKNFIIEDIDRFIDEYESIYVIRDFQYIKQSLNLTIKVNLSQANLSVDADNLTYLSIKNSDDSRIYYYFITNKIWRSENTIEFQLTMDTLNTFKWNDDYSVDKKTLVFREHKDRITTEDGNIKRRLIDLQSEGINAPLYKTKEKDIIDKVDTSWVLFYRNSNAIDPSDFNQVNPVDCYLMAKNPITVEYSTTSSQITTSMLGDGYSILIAPKYNQVQPIFKCNGVSFTPSIIASNLMRCVEILRDGTDLIISLYDYYIQEFWGTKKTKISSQKTSNPIEIVNPQSNVNIYTKFGVVSKDEFWVSGQRYNYINSNNTLYFGAMGTATLDGTELIDRTDSRNIKIIDIPYSPTTFSYDGTNVSFESVWEYIALDKMLKLDNLDVQFENDFSVRDVKPFENLSVELVNPTDEDLRNDNLESKIYHSDFYIPKFVYDSFSLPFRLELVDNYITEHQSQSHFDIQFVMSRNITSKFLFKFPQYVLKYGNEDYPNVVCVSRNNEEVLYTSQYINYLRNGYNFDLKTKQRNELTGGVGIGLSALSSLIGVVGGFASGNYALALGSMVAGGISIASQSVSYAKSIAESEQNLQQKLESSRRQAVSVQNADDVDLLYAYSQNKAKVCWYEVSPRMKQALLDMFYYCGYTTQEQKVPNVESRYWFNFLQCKLVLGSTCNLPMSIIENIKSKFEEGCTFFHNHNDVWDIEQLKENYETWILE